MHPRVPWPRPLLSSTVVGVAITDLDIRIPINEMGVTLAKQWSEPLAQRVSTLIDHRYHGRRRRRRPTRRRGTAPLRELVSDPV